MLILSLALILSCAAILILSRNTLYTAHPWEGTNHLCMLGRTGR